MSQAGCISEGCTSEAITRGLCGKHYAHMKRRNNLPPRETVVDRFWKKVDKSGACWLWTGSLSPKGYGEIRTGNTNTRAHHFDTASEAEVAVIAKRNELFTHNDQDKRGAAA